jgi:hypothetical protein
MSAEKLIKESYNLLATVIEEAYDGAEEGNFRQAFVYRHGLTILHLAEDAIHLEAERKCHSSPLVVRSMLESLFNLVAGVKDPKFAAEKVCWEIEDEVKRIQKWMNNGDELDETIKQLQGLARTIKKDHGISSNRSWTTLDCAKAADLDKHYRTDYFLFSKKVHSTTSGMISAEAEFGRGYILRTISFVLLCASVHLVQLIQTKTSQKHVDSGTTLLEDLARLIGDGAFRKLDETLRC